MSSKENEKGEATQWSITLLTQWMMWGASTSCNDAIEDDAGSALETWRSRDLFSDTGQPRTLLGLLAAVKKRSRRKATVDATVDETLELGEARIAARAILNALKGLEQNEDDDSIQNDVPSLSSTWQERGGGATRKLEFRALGLEVLPPLTMSLLAELAEGVTSETQDRNLAHGTGASEEEEEVPCQGKTTKICLAAIVCAWYTEMLQLSSCMEDMPADVDTLKKHATLLATELEEAILELAPGIIGRMGVVAGGEHPLARGDSGVPHARYGGAVGGDAGRPLDRSNTIHNCNTLHRCNTSVIFWGDLEGQEARARALHL